MKYFHSLLTPKHRLLILFSLALAVTVGYMRPVHSQMQDEIGITEVPFIESSIDLAESAVSDRTLFEAEAMSTEPIANEPIANEWTEVLTAEAADMGANEPDSAPLEATPDEIEAEPNEVEAVAEEIEAEPNEVEAVTEEIEAAPDEPVTAESPEVEGSAEEATEDSPPVLTASERIRRKLLIQADNEYAAGNFDAAQALYQQAKDESWLLPQQFSTLPPAPFSDAELLSPAGAVYWREAQAGVTNQRTSQTLSALRLLTSEYPAFTPGTVLYTSVLAEQGDLETANTAIEDALTLYPANPELLLAQVELMMNQEKWIEAAIASRQFTALNPDHPATPEQTELAAENLSRFQGETQQTIRNGAIANLFTGVLGYAFTGSIFGPFTAANSAVLLLQGENAVGSQFANQIEQQLPMLQHPEANAYISRMGKRLAAATGRRDLDYEFYVILDPNLNAFALPGGKIFVNAGAILDTRSEAELAGLLSHELAHSVLSHGFQLATQSNLTSSVAQYLPYGGIINNVFLSGYSRDMERQADIVGTQILASSGYAADGVYHVMVTLNEQAEAAGRNVPTWISSHPNPADRVDYLKTLVERGGYNRYAYEGVASHEEIQAIVARELAAYEAEQAAQNGNAEEIVDEAVEERRGEEPQNNLYDAVERFNW